MSPRPPPLPLLPKPMPGQMPHPRLWPALPSQIQTELAQQVARLLRRVREEAHHADGLR